LGEGTKKKSNSTGLDTSRRLDVKRKEIVIEHDFKLNLRRSASNDAVSRTFLRNCRSENTTNTWQIATKIFESDLRLVPKVQSPRESMTMVKYPTYQDLQFVVPLTK
jgi:poly-D-alanine transfer protein DltD